MIIFHKTLEPEDVLKAVALVIKNQFPDNYQAEITCKFIDDFGSVEVCVEKKDHNSIN